MEIQQQVLLAPYTTFKVGGSADYFCSVTNIDELRESVRFAASRALPFFILGGGSNVVVSDNGFQGLVIRMRCGGIARRSLGDAAVEFSVGAGEDWDAFVARAVTEGLYGIENLSGIPGSVGATVIQNVGAYGVEVRDFIASVEAFDPDTMALRTLKNEECAFGYRDSFFKTREGSRFIITRVIFQLALHGVLNTSYKDVRDYFSLQRLPPSLQSLREAILIIRARKFPDLARFGTAGSFFKNPLVREGEYALLREQFPDIPGFPGDAGYIKVPAAWLIEHVGGYRGKRVGAVGSFENQALVIVNYGGASAKDIVRFTDAIAETIADKTGVVLEREVRVVGSDGVKKD